MPLAAHGVAPPRRGGAHRRLRLDPGPAADAQADPPDQELPPPADEAYDHATYPLRRECRGGCLADELVELRRAVAGRADVLRWESDLGAFRARVCALDGAAELVAYSSDPGRWLERPRACPWSVSGLMTARVLQLLAARDGGELARHLEARKAWGDAVLAGLAAVAVDFGGPCVARSMSRDDCAPPKLPLRRQVVARVRAAIADAKALGDELCRVAPELGAALGDRCGATAAAYLVSFAAALARSDLLDR